MKINIDRQSGIELLRLLAAMMVIVVHYNYNYAYRSSDITETNLVVLNLADSLSLPAVNIFMIITGYFSCLSYHRSIGKPLNLVFQVCFWHLVFYLLGGAEFSIRNLIFRIIYPDYFVTLYVLVYVFSPYLNMIFEKMPMEKFRFMLISFFIVFSMYAFLIDLLNRDFNLDFRFGSPIGISGGAGGCSFVNFCLIYLIGAYVKKSAIQLPMYKAVCGFLICSFIIFTYRFYEMSLGIESVKSAMRSYHNPLVVLQAFFALLWAQNLTFKSNLVNKLASAAFTCYMVQHFFLDKIGISYILRGPTYELLMHLLISVAAIYIVSFILYWLYTKSINKVFSSLEKKNISYNL